MQLNNLKDELFKAWEEFVTRGVVNRGCIRPEIEQSWRRSLHHKVDARMDRVQIRLTGKGLAERREQRQELLEISLPIMKNLYSFVKGSGFIVSLTDRDGIVLESYGDPETVGLAREHNMVPGADMREEFAGSNATGLALKLQKPVQVFAAEHYVRALQRWTCSAGPIRDHAGELTGVLSMTGTFEKVHSHTLGMVVAAADAVEGQLKVNKVLDNLLVNTRFMNAIVESISDGLIAVDELGRVLKINPAAVRILKLNGDDVTQRPVQEILGGTNPVLRALASGEKVNDEELQVDTVRGKAHFIVSCRPISNPQQKVVGAVAVLREFKSVRQLVQRMVGARAKFTFDDLIGKNTAYLKTVQMAKMAADSSSTVLLLGESGTGKEVFAQAIHNAGDRRSEPFIAINCAALPRELIGSELFGYSEGAFTGAKRGGNPGKFELADGGTIFLDEIGEMPIEMQANLLRVLQEKTVMRIGGNQVLPVDVRVIAATNKDLLQAVRQNTFRPDLYYRLNVININMVPLRMRKDDILPLTGFFVENINQRLGKNAYVIHPETLDILQRYHWPGNVRELENIIERSINVATEETLTPDTLPQELLEPFYRPMQSAEADQAANMTEIRATDTAAPACTPLPTPQAYAGYPAGPRRPGRELIFEAIISNEGNLTNAARDLGISRSTLYRKLSKYGIKFSGGRLTALSGKHSMPYMDIVNERIRFFDEQD